MCGHVIDEHELCNAEADPDCAYGYCPEHHDDECDGDCVDAT